MTGATKALPSDAPPVVWTHDFKEGDILKCRFGRQGDRLVADWPYRARLTCDAQGNDVRVTPHPGAAPQMLAKLRGMVKVLVGDLKGGLGFHASAVAIGGRAVMILGDSDAGKSTTAAELCLGSRGRLLSDDVALLTNRNGTFYVLPSEDRHYLSPASGKALGVRVAKSRLGPRGKAAIRPANTATRGYRLDLVVFLRFDDALAGLRRSSPRGIDAARRLLSSLYRFNLTERGSELERVMCVYKQVRFFEMARPHSRPSVVEELLRTLVEAS
jgi:hypothetical protein